MKNKPAVVDFSQSPYIKLQPIPITDYHIRDNFLAPRLQTNITDTLLSQYELCEKTGRIDNFRRASKKKDLPFQGRYYNDSDVYKWLEAIGYCLPHQKQLLELSDIVSTEICDAQKPNGYLNTYFTIDRENERWTNIRDLHELYCAGHFIQAAIAHYRTTQNEKLLSSAVKLANHICDIFGDTDNQKKVPSGHPEIELALVELYRVTRDQKYLKQAQFFIDVRGYGYIGGRDYHWDHIPLRQTQRLDGHAVRDIYFLIGATDLYAETGEKELWESIIRLWKSMTQKQMYIHGGIGSRYDGESFGKDYELPNERSYSETCAAIASFFWNHRLLSVTAEAKYADLMEHTLYNAVLCGLSLDGKKYFYQNPLADDGNHRRSEWFDCACCPPNVSRLLASLSGYVASFENDSVYYHLYAQGDLNYTNSDGNMFTISLETNYPFEENLHFTIKGNGRLTVYLRIPGWCEKPTLMVNKKEIEVKELGSYVKIDRTWKSGDTIQFNIPLNVRKLSCHPYVAENYNSIAFMRGPILYCFERIDNPDHDLRDIIISPNTEISFEKNKQILDEAVVLKLDGTFRKRDTQWEQNLYLPLKNEKYSDTEKVSLIAIPYFAWGNREPGRMQVWMKME